MSFLRSTERRTKQDRIRNGRRRRRRKKNLKQNTLE
jgi:hypothetical protein